MEKSSEKTSSWIHFIGISGVTMAPIANAFKEQGWFVTGSDKGFFPPMSTYLIEKAITVEVGFRKEHLKREYYKEKYGDKLNFDLGKHPDLVVIGASMGSKNPELLFAKEQKLKVKSYPQVLEKYEIKEGGSIVVSGTYGKTTITSLLVHIFQKAGENISFMIGALAKDIPDGVKLKDEDTKWSITEGDEYVSASFDQRSKFVHYHPNYLILTSAELDHTDIFPTKEAFIENFKNLAESVPSEGLIVANKNGENIDQVVENATAKVIFYEYDEKDFPYEEKLIGDHNRENIIAAATLARNLNLPSETIKEAVASFQGIKRRLEIRLDLEDAKVIDDFGSTPAKARGSLAAVKQEFSKYKIVAIFEPNAGNRTQEAVPLYDNVFKDAAEVIIPRLSSVKSKEGQMRLGGRDLAEVIAKTHKRVVYFTDDDKLIEYLAKFKGKKVIVFMGSHGFRGMIERTIKTISGG